MQQDTEVIVHMCQVPLYALIVQLFPGNTSQSTQQAVTDFHEPSSLWTDVERPTPPYFGMALRDSEMSCRLLMKE